MANCPIDISGSTEIIGGSKSGNKGNNLLAIGNDDDDGGGDSMPTQEQISYDILNLFAFKIKPSVEEFNRKRKTPTWH